MANQEHLDILKQGVEVWNKWREEHPDVRPNLSFADLRDANLRDINFIKADLSCANLRSVDLSYANLSTGIDQEIRWGTDLSGADLSHSNLRMSLLDKANLWNANLTQADLSEADISHTNLSHTTFTGANLSNTLLIEADLTYADFREADLRSAVFRGANLFYTNLTGADLTGANLSYAILINTNLSRAILTNCHVFGTSVWDVDLTDTKQSGLTVTRNNQWQPKITVDDLEIAQFIYLLLNNKRIRDVIDMITSKVVLILGRFTPERKAVLDALRDELRKRNYSPVLFDFEKPVNRDITETVSTLAHMARFVIADITDAKSIPQELMVIVPNLPSVPVQPLILESQREYGMFEHFARFPWVLPIYHYTDEESLLHSLQAKVIEPAEQKAQELEKR